MQMQWASWSLWGGNAKKMRSFSRNYETLRPTPAQRRCPQGPLEAKTLDLLSDTASCKENQWIY